MISGVTSVKNIHSLFVVGAIHLFIKYNSCNYWIHLIIYICIFVASFISNSIIYCNVHMIVF